jgi:hypothetical protein
MSLILIFGIFVPKIVGIFVLQQFWSLGGNLSTASNTNPSVMAYQLEASIKTNPQLQKTGL